MLSDSASIKKFFYINTKSLVLEGLRSTKWMNKKALPKEQYQPAYVEHIANIITHAIWIFPSILGAAELYQRSQNNAQVASAFVYGLTLISLFFISTSFHSVFYCNSYRYLKDVLHRCDRAMIYIFIAGSYFPWLTIEQLPLEGWSLHMRWVVWLMALLGIAYQQIFHEKYKKLEVLFYLIMGVCPVLPIISEHYFLGMMELTIGGILYVTGVIFFKCDGVIPFAHAIWHLFVATAAYFHYYAILNYLYPIVNVGHESHS
ncbi:monocyte to macrophage differentiation factor [Sitophilus oryzae]|uniref:Monocyte to macrophage differentiation factor n=1 Tax=Sitophilus oryzae TaxID=7048 RepID=A0A6J2X2D9_SITOR|nr:monocyte to macrophage differentiation factor [Sitophilus oryzae]XP_030745298.1 monocyte to macrophage differentiation factor [Sitophilus oryzae]XP_030745299.1 monocyte to macrophage differentiation factor [Sitophilus oryzae]XP_030745301.1 monocyte to macrophage differentiation factor [Sitophilus oryzae]XP_030745302.1 monocyte to macrophage differentiation factor [Sitophilus oryzae]